MKSHSGFLVTYQLINDTCGRYFSCFTTPRVGFGADREGELALAKGEVMALQGAVSINC